MGIRQARCITLTTIHSPYRCFLREGNHQRLIGVGRLRLGKKGNACKNSKEKHYKATHNPPLSVSYICESGLAEKSLVLFPGAH